MGTNFVQILDRSGPLSEVEKRALAEAVSSTIVIEAHQDLVIEKRLPSDSPILLSGFACRYKLFDEGERQIVALHVPGDFCDLHALFVPSDHHVRALVPSMFAMIPRRKLLDLVSEHPNIGHTLWRSTLRDGAIFREWMSYIGRQDAYTRLAHLICELVIRSRDTAVGDGKSCPMPLTQMELGDTLGLSYVHVNRVLKRLRDEKLITLAQRNVEVLDWDRLAEAGRFDPGYLRFHSEAPRRKQRELKQRKVTKRVVAETV